MRLASLKLENYRKYRNATVEFSDGIMGIVGRNGAGKSTIIEAIGWCLYGAPAARSNQDEIATTGLPRGMPCTVTLEMEAGGEAIRVVRTVKAGQTAGTANLYVQGQSGATVTGSNEVTEYVGRKLGMDWAAFFSSVFARQKDLDALVSATPGKRREIITRLLRIDIVDDALRMVRDDEKLRLSEINVLRGEAADVGAIKADIEDLEGQLDAKRSEIDAASDDASALHKSLEAAKLELARQDDAKERHDGHRAALDTATSLLGEKSDRRRDETDKLEEMKRDQAQLDELEPLIKDYSRVKKDADRMEHDARRHEEKAAAEDAVADVRSKAADQQSRMDEWRKSHGSLASKMPDMEELDSRLDGLSKSLEGIRGAESRAHARADDLSERARKTKETVSSLEALGEGGTCPTCKQRLGDSFAGLVKDLSKEASALQAKADELNGEASDARREAASVQSDIDDANKARAAASEADREMTSLQDRIEEAEKNVAGLRNDEKKHARTLSRLSGLSYDKATHDRLKDRLSEMEKTREKAISLRSATRAMPATSSGIQKLTREIAAQKTKIAKAMKAIEKIAYDPSAHSAARSDYESLGAEHNAATVAIASLEGDAKAIKTRLADARKNLVYEQKRARKIKRMEKEIEVLAKLKAVMAAFKDDLTSRIRPALGSRASALLRRMTGGRYPVVELDADYGITIESDGERFRTARFSGGEQDLASLCLRIAVSQELSDRAGSEGPSFIVLDEVFGSQDSERRDSILKALSAISDEFRQIILITHIEDVKDALPYALHVREDKHGSPSISVEGRPPGGAGP